MGAKTWMIAYVDGKADEILKANPPLDRIAAAQVASLLFPADQLEPIDDGDLSYTSPPDDEIHIGCFPGLTIVAASELGLDKPSQLPERFLEAAQGRTVYLHAMHSAVDWFAYAIWERGRLVRSLSLSPDSGVIEDLGERRAFEEPYWSGQHPLDEDYPLPFHPLDLGEAALLDLFGYQIEGYVDAFQFQPEEIPLAAFQR